MKSAPKTLRESTSVATAHAPDTSRNRKANDVEDIDQIHVKIKYENHSPTPPSNSRRATARIRLGSMVENTEKTEFETETTLAWVIDRNPISSPPSTSKKAEVKMLQKINPLITKRLDIYVFGTGENGELGLGPKKDARSARRPRLNLLLPPEAVGVVSLAAGETHAIALTHDHKILTWGLNDLGALGRDTTWDMSDTKEDRATTVTENENFAQIEDGDSLNPHEAVPTFIPESSFPGGTKFVQVSASENASFALTDTGLVYGWGTFRNNDGILGFCSDTHVQRRPRLLPGLKRIKKLACGTNHVLALDFWGNVFAWGSGQQNQLGRRIVERTRMHGLIPQQFGLPRKQIIDIAAGAYHNFALDKKGNVWTWGLNTYGECGIAIEPAELESIISKPTLVKNLAPHKIICISAGFHHSIAINEQGECLIWGRADGPQSGIPMATLRELGDNCVQRDRNDTVRVLSKPLPVPNLPKCVFAAAGFDCSLVITRKGQAYAWGSNDAYQIGLGHDEDVAQATLIDNSAIHGETLTWAGSGNQFSMLAGFSKHSPKRKSIVGGEQM